MVFRFVSTTLGVIGSTVGGACGYWLFDYFARRGIIALVVPGAALGLGCGVLARHDSWLRGIACAIAAILLGLYAVWKIDPLGAENWFPYAIVHFFDVRLLYQIMIGLGGALAFYLGKDAWFVRRPREGVASAKGVERE